MGELCAVPAILGAEKRPPFPFEMPPVPPALPPPLPPPCLWILMWNFGFLSANQSGRVDRTLHHQLARQFIGRDGDGMDWPLPVANSNICQSLPWRNGQCRIRTKMTIPTMTFFKRSRLRRVGFTRYEIAINILAIRVAKTMKRISIPRQWDCSELQHRVFGRLTKQFG